MNSTVRRKAKSLEAKFFEKVGPLTENGCRLWTAAVDSRGYGKIGHDGKTLQAHRLAWEFANGRRLERGECVLHSCDVPACVAPEHLSVGNQAENMRQAFARDRVTGAQIRWANRSLRSRRPQGGT